MIEYDENLLTFSEKCYMMKEERGEDYEKD